MGLRDSLIKATPKATDSFSILPLNNLDQYPIINYQFAIKIGEAAEPVALFQKMSGMRVERNIDELTDGGMNEFTLEFPREFSYSHLTLETGLSSSDFFYKWMMYGKEQGFAYSQKIVLEQKLPDKDAKSPKTWRFDGAYPVRWEISDLSVGNSNNIVIETLELSFNFFELE